MYKCVLFCEFIIDLLRIEDIHVPERRIIHTHDTSDRSQLETRKVHAMVDNRTQITGNSVSDLRIDLYV